MTVPCSCKIPDPVVVNGTCLVCYGERPSIAETHFDRAAQHGDDAERCYCPTCRMKEYLPVLGTIH